MIVKGTSSRGTLTVDTYSLSGRYGSNPKSLWPNASKHKTTREIQQKRLTRPLFCFIQPRIRPSNQPDCPLMDSIC